MKNNLLNQYIALLKVDNVDLAFTKGGIEQIAEVAIKLNNTVENIGARRLHSCVRKIIRKIYV